jgi:tetratricopeptide (TPR) repeat protein
MRHSHGSSDPTSYCEQAEAVYRKALELAPGRPAALVGLAWVANTQHDFQAGRRWARQALASDPRLAEAHALLGDAAMELGDYDEAFEHFQRSLDLRPNLSAYARAAQLVWVTGDAQRAKTLMSKAITAGPFDTRSAAWCRAALARMMFDTGALLPAEKQAELSLGEEPDQPDALLVLARIKTARQDLRAAVALCEQALASGPRHAPLVLLADLYQLAGDAPMAERTAQRVIDYHRNRRTHTHTSPGGETIPQPVSAGATKGVGHSQVGPELESIPHQHGDSELARFLADHDRDLECALAEAEAAYETLKNVHAADTLAWCYYKTGRLADAARLIRRALRWNTPDAAILFHAGMIHAKLPDRSTAQKYLYQSLSLNPHFHPRDAALARQQLDQLAATPAQLPSALKPAAAPANAPK